MHFKRGHLSKKADLSLESIIRLVLVSISLLIAFYVGFAIYEALVGGPDTGSIKSLDDISVLVKTDLTENTPVQRNVYIKHELSIFTFSSGDESVTHGAGTCGNDGTCEVPRPVANAPPRGCGTDIENACMCMCDNKAQAGSDHCSKVFECRTFPKTYFIAMKSFAEPTAEIEGISGGLLMNGMQGRYFVIFGDRATSKVTGVNSFWFTMKKEGDYQVIYITKEKPDIKPVESPGQTPAGESTTTQPRTIPAGDITEDECNAKEGYFSYYNPDGSFRLCVICLEKCTDYNSEYTCNDVSSDKCSLECDWDGNGCVDSQ